MREGNSLQENMIDRNWVLKRKRKRISSVLGSSNGKESISHTLDSPRNNPSDTKKLKGDNDIVQFSLKIKGHDGYYFECVECDLGGNLLCCDSCPRTYHLECLNPPLKRPPPGKWHCPSCCEKDNVKTLSNMNANSKRARTKSTFEKSKSVHNISGHEKALLSGKTSILGKKRLNKKGKAILSCIAPSIKEKSDSSQVDTSCSIKSSPSHGSGTKDDISMTAHSIIKKNPDSPFHLRISSRKQIHSSVEALNSDVNAKISKGKVNLHSSEMQEKKPLSLVRSSKISKKDRQKVNSVRKKKRSRSQKGKHIEYVSNHTPKDSSPLPENSGSHKRKSLGLQSSSLITKEERKVLKISIKKHPETPTEEASLSPCELDKYGVGLAKTMKYGESILDGDQQVDRILGCRVQGSSVMSSCDTQTFKANSPALTKLGNDLGRLTNRLSSSEVTGSVDHNKLSEVYNDGSRVPDRKDVKRMRDEECHIDENCIAGKIDMNDKNALATKETHRIGEHTDKDEVMEVEDVKKGSEDSAHIEIASVGSQGNQPVPYDPEGANAPSKEAQLDSSAQNRKLNREVVYMGPQGDNPVMYEYLVKWVGQSNIHNIWISESQLKILAKRKLENYKAKYGTALINICEEQWCKPQRVIALRVSKGGRTEALTKWHGLPYDDCTWEKLDEPVIKNSAHLVAELKLFESQTLEKDRRDDIPRVKVDGQEVTNLTEQPKELKGGSLFPHQLEALNWLRKCWLKSKNVILADEMGLGKTVSACAFISSLYIEFKAKLPCLVLVPLSTMPNWLAEFSLWAPHLNVVEYHGPAKARSIIRQFEWHANDSGGLHKLTTSYKFNVLLTTYEMVLADASHLRGVPWEVLIVDEGHRLKNSGSKLFGLLNSLSFQYRVLLTGTPLQNNIGEMYNLLNFLQPASFPSLSAFEERFNDLTTAEKVEELKKLVAPHMLRRLKKDAMQNIPPKTERMVPVELTSIQAEYYRAMLTKNYQVLRNVGKGGAQQSMLNIVMQLRKVCNHPYLITGTEPESGSIEFLQEMRIKASAKLTLLHSMLRVLHKEGHRVLIFSQMTKLLDILEDYLLIEFGPKTFERVDGSVAVADRQAAIARFNQDKTRFVFLLSTRSCGLGINLATADTVIIYDSDFNPHADIQAMNRAHRIGQSNRLLVYRLVVRASVEERILQLAKKKLMLDQLFVNKSESQKEVEDILRWGTEELFNDFDGLNAQDSKETSSNKLETPADGEHKHRRRSGGLGDVYQDRCAESSVKIVWDENAISKLLDRSNLQSSYFESTDGDAENDMLGSVKSVDWNEELNEESGGTDLLPSIAEDGCEQSFEAKEDNAINGTEENEWDRLLRVRWEKYQIEEEATLGRGKRLRKAVSYKETFASIPSEVLSESGKEEEEPEPVYTPAGRALKEKYAKLRARQKERIAQRHNTVAPGSTDNPELLMDSRALPVNEGHNLDTSKHLDDAKEEASPIILDETKLSQPSQPKRSDSSAKIRFSKHGYKRYHSTHLNLSDKPPGNLSPDVFPQSHQFRRTSSANPVPSANLLPVLGLCAPNANQVNSTPRNFRSLLSQPLSNADQRRASTGASEFPFPPVTNAGNWNDPNTSCREPNADPSLLPDISSEALQRRLKNIIPDFFPFCPPPSTSSGRDPAGPLESSGASFSSFQERLGLPNLILDDKPLSKFPLSSKNAMKPHTDLLPSLSLGTHMEFMNTSSQDFPNIPMVPNFTQKLNDGLKQKQHMTELPPMLGLSQMQAPHASLPENHKKVLDNIMMRTQSASQKFLKKKSKLDAWSEDELDALWIGVRRHGKGNWDTMLRDPKLKFSKYRTAEDLSARWREEQHKIMDGPTFAGPVPSKPASFLGISDSMMTRALYGSKFASIGAEPSKFRSHLTDIKLACGNITSGLPCIDRTTHFPTTMENYPAHPIWLPNKVGSSYLGDFSTGPFNRLEKMTLPVEQPFLNNSFPLTNFGALSSNFPTACNVQNSEDGSCANMINKLPSFLDKSLNLLRDACNSIHSDESNKGMLLDLKKRQISVKSPMDDDNNVGSSKSNILPHWLREAVNVPPSRPPEPHLPPTVSAIAQSVRLLCKEEKPTIPPFSILGPPPSQPKDPRKMLKKKRKHHKLRQATPEIATSINNFVHASSSAVHPVAAMMSAPGLSRTSPSPSPPALSLNLNSPSSSSSDTQVKEPCAILSPSPEVVQLVGFHAASEQCTPPVLEMQSPCSDRTECPSPDDFENFEQAEKGVEIGGLKGIEGQQKTSRDSPSGSSGTREKQINGAECGDSSKTHSDPCGANQLKAEETLSEDIMLNDHKNEQEI